VDPMFKVVLLEDGIYLDTGPLKGKAKLYALEKDVEKRGLSGRLDGVELIDYEGLVDLLEGDKVATFG